MSTQTIQSAGPATMPRVNLMPPEIAEAARFKQVQAGLGGAVLAAVAIAGLLYYHEHSGVSTAKAQLAQAQAQNASLQTKLRSLDSVKQTFAAVAARQQLLATAMGPEVRWSFVLNDLSFRMPTNVWLTNMAVTPAVAQAAATTGPSTLTSAAAAAPAVFPIATITFAGTGLKHDDVAVWLEALAKEKNFANPAFTNSTKGAIGDRTVVNFSSNVTVMSGARTNRYAVPPATRTTPTTTTTTPGTTP